MKLHCVLTLEYINTEMHFPFTFTDLQTVPVLQREQGVHQTNKIYENHLKETMKQRPVFGMIVYSGCPQMVELLGYTGFDFALIDAEHCPWETTSLRETILAARAAGVSPLVRVTEPDMIQIRKALEMGAEGVIVPHVRTAEEMELCVRGAKFPPLGRRGYDTNVRAAQYGVDVDGMTFCEEANRTELVIPMAEDFEFMENLDEMLSVPGIDAVLFGPADFSISLRCKGGAGPSDSGPAVAALRGLAAKTRVRGISVMAPALPATYENAKRLMDWGVNMVAMGSDLSNYSAAFRSIREETLSKLM